MLRGESTPELLETYDAERRPIALLRHEQIFARPDYKAEARGFAEGVAILDDAAMELGQLYRSAAVLGAEGDLPPAKRPEEWAGQPGTRAPHVVLAQGQGHLSTLDLFQRAWVLLAEEERWRSAAAEAKRRTGIDVVCMVDGVDVRPKEPDAIPNRLRPRARRRVARPARRLRGLANCGASRRSCLERLRARSRAWPRRGQVQRRSVPPVTSSKTPRDPAELAARGVTSGAFTPRMRAVSSV